MFRRIAITLVILLLSVAAAAQDTATLSYGSAVEDSITNERFEIFYSLKGEAGALVILEMIALGDDSELGSPELILYDEDKNVIVDTLRHFGFEQARLALELPYTGTYELLATRRDGRVGDDTGDFRLRYIQPPVLAPGETIADSTQNNKIINYYAVTEVRDFSVFYEAVEGDFTPEIEAYRVDNGELTNVASLRGNEMKRGSIGVDGSTAAAFIFTVGDSPFAFYFDDVVEQVDYNMSLALDE